MKSFEDPQDLILVYTEPNCLGLDKEKLPKQSRPNEL